MQYVVKVEVSLKTGHSDPEGETTKKSLQELNYYIDSVRVGKIYHIILEANSLEEAKKLVKEMCRRLLSNPVKDNYVFQIEERR
jgi:phosphoribosylformylglycinamidine synthase